MTTLTFDREVARRLAARERLYSHFTTRNLVYYGGRRWTFGGPCPDTEPTTVRTHLLDGQREVCRIPRAFIGA